MSKLEDLAKQYERAESAYLALLRDRAPRDALGKSARDVAAAAIAWKQEAWRKYHAAEDDAWESIEVLAENAEMLSELWADIAAAYPS